MRTRMWVVISVAAALSGCGPKPEEVCAHAEELAKKANKSPIPNCAFRMQMKLDTKKAEYDKIAPCIMAATDAEGVNGCLAQHQTE